MKPCAAAHHKTGSPPHCGWQATTATSSALPRLVANHLKSQHTTTRARHCDPNNPSPATAHRHSRSVWQLHTTRRPSRGVDSGPRFPPSRRRAATASPPRAPHMATATAAAAVAVTAAAAAAAAFAAEAAAAAALATTVTATAAASPSRFGSSRRSDHVVGMHSPPRPTSAVNKPLPPRRRNREGALAERRLRLHSAARFRPNDPNAR